MIAPGIYPGLGMESYHGWKIDKGDIRKGPISCSLLKAFAPNPYAWLHGPEREQTAAMRLGTVFDVAVTDPKRLKEILPLPVFDAFNFAVSPFENFRTKQAQEWKREAEESGLPVITAAGLEKLQEEHKAACESVIKQRDKAESAAAAVLSHKVAGPLLDGAQFQVGVIGEAGTIPAKCLIDILPHGREMIVDYKTISTGLDDKSIRDAIGKYKYHWQGAFYRSLFNKVSPDRHIEKFALIFQDVNTLEVRVEVLSDDAMSAGNRAVGIALKEFTRCAHNGITSRYAQTMGTVELQPYHAMAEEDWNIAMEGGEG